MKCIQFKGVKRKTVRIEDDKARTFVKAGMASFAPKWAWKAAGRPVDVT